MLSVTEDELNVVVFDVVLVSSHMELTVGTTSNGIFAYINSIEADCVANTDMAFSI